MTLNLSGSARSFLFSRKLASPESMTPGLREMRPVLEGIHDNESESRITSEAIRG